MWARKELRGCRAPRAWPSHPTLGTWVWHLPVEESLSHTVCFSQAASALRVALNFCTTPAASAEEARAR